MFRRNQYLHMYCSRLLVAGSNALGEFGAYRRAAARGGAGIGRRDVVAMQFVDRPLMLVQTTRGLVFWAAWSSWVVTAHC